MLTLESSDAAEVTILVSLFLSLQLLRHCASVIILQITLLPLFH
jgi:hypothetical protein